MSEYLPSFLVEPVLRQARRLSRINGGEEGQEASSSTSPPNTAAASSTSYLPQLPQFPQVPDLQRWYPSRFWNTSPPPSIDEEDNGGENKETTVQSLARTIQLWTNQLNNLDLDLVPSPPLDPTDDPSARSRLAQNDDPDTIEFPALGHQQAPQERPARLHEHRASSETSLNPAAALANRSRALAEASRGHSQSDPLGAIDPAHSLDAARARQLEYNQDGYLRRRDGSDTLPEDDGMSALRQRISAIWSGPGTSAEKSRLLNALMMERYKASQRQQQQQISPSSSKRKRDPTDPNTPPRLSSPLSIATSSKATTSQDDLYNLNPADKAPTYAPLDPDEVLEGDPAPLPKHLGCIHYRRNVKMQCSQCLKWYTCRICHDSSETSHTLPRRLTKNMLCMLCLTPQAAAQICRACGGQAACYYCPICKLWNNDPRKSIYHCDDCGICRLGEGLGKDFFHCQKCAACMSITAEATHKCVERSTKCDCPICGEYMFESSQPVAFMRCGHSIHESCFAEWCNTSYKCPICSKSVANMESQFRRLDRHIEEQPMPEEYRDNKAYIFCNDCNSRSVTKYHWLGLKCTLCDSYNTMQLDLLGHNGEDPDRTVEIRRGEDRVTEAGAGERGMTASQGLTPAGELVSLVGNEGDASDSSVNFASTGAPCASVGSARSPTVGSPWLLPHSPTQRSARSVSPVVGSYFGTSASTELRPGSQHQHPAQVNHGAMDIDTPRRGTPMDDDDDLDFWGGQSPRSPDIDVHLMSGARAVEEESESSSEGEDDGMDQDEADDEEEEVDAMDILGHR